MPTDRFVGSAAALKVGMHSPYLTMQLPVLVAVVHGLDWDGLVLVGGATAAAVYCVGALVMGGVAWWRARRRRANYQGAPAGAAQDNAMEMQDR